MALFLDDNPEEAREHRLGADWLVIHREPCRNTAAKFWSRLLDELAVAYPRCDRVVLTATDDSPLDPGELRPEKQLEDDFEKLRNKDLRSMVKGLITQMELFGPPQPVRATLFAGDTEILSRELPVTCVDSSVFPYLLVWLLAWAQVPHLRWNNESVGGRFSAEDVRREITYDLLFVLRNRDLSEGLAERQLTLERRRC